MNVSTTMPTKAGSISISSEDYWNEKLHVSMPTNGALPMVGSQAPNFFLTNIELKNVTLATYPGSRKILSILPSLDVPMCQALTRKLNQAKANLDNTVILVISADLPFAQRQFYESEGLHDVVTLSTFRSTFAVDYGVEIIAGELTGLMTPSVLVLDEQNQVIYSQTTTELANELDYDAIIEVLTPPAVLLSNNGYISSLPRTQPVNRRESFRIEPLTTSCYCNIPLSEPKENATPAYRQAYTLATSKIYEKLKSQQRQSDKKVMSDVNVVNVMRLNLRDISSTGCSMFNHDHEFSYFLTPHTIYKDCIIHMPDNVEVKVSFKIMLKKMIEHSTKGGCNEVIAVEFINMTQALESTISYYVREIERQRISLLALHDEKFGGYVPIQIASD